MQRKYNKSNKSFGGVGVIGVGGLLGLIILLVWTFSGTEQAAQQEATPDVTHEFTGTITTATMTGSEYLKHVFTGYNVLSDDWETMWSYYEKETWTFTLELENKTVVTCKKVFLADTVNISLFHANIDGTIPTNIVAKITGSYADDKVTFRVNSITNLNTGSSIEFSSPEVPPGTTTAPAPAEV